MPWVFEAMSGGAVDIVAVRGSCFLLTTGGKRWKAPTAPEAQQEMED